MENLNPEQENLFLKIKSELDEHLDKRVDEHLEKDRNLIKETISTVSTIFKWTVGIAALLVTILGVKTYLDIKERIDVSIQSSIKSKIDSSNVLSIYDKKASKLYRQSLIESYMIKIKKKENDSDPFGVEINKLEFEELLHTITDKETETDDFKKALFILTKVRIPQEGAKQNDLNKILTSIVINKDKKFDWLSEQDGKREYLLSAIGSLGIEDCKSYCTDILKNKLASPDILIASINYLKSIHDRESLPLIDVLTKSDNEEIQIAAIKAVAFIDFQSNTIKDFLAKLNNQKIPPSDGQNIFAVLNEILLGTFDNAKRRNFALDITQKEKDKIDSTTTLVSQSILKLMPHFILSASSSFSSNNYDIAITEINNEGTSYSIPSKLFFGFSYLIPNKMLHTNSMDDFKKIISFLTIKVSKFDETNSDFNSVSADLNYGGGILTEFGRIDKKLIDNKCWFNLINSTLKLNFWDKGGNIKILNVIKLEGIDSINFSLTTKQNLSKDFSMISYD